MQPPAYHFISLRFIMDFFTDSHHYQMQLRKMKVSNFNKKSIFSYLNETTALVNYK